MSAPGSPVITIIDPAAAKFMVTIELSQADLLAIDATADWRKEVGTATPTGFTNAVRFTLSRRSQVPPS